MNNKELKNSNLKSLLMRILNPKFWIQAGKTTDEMTLLVNEIIENDLGLTCDGFYLKTINQKCIWVENYPYAFGHQHELIASAERISLKSRDLPNIETRIKLKKYIEEKFGHSSNTDIKM